MGKPSERRSDLAASQSDDEDAWHGESFKRVSLKGNETKCALYLGYTDLGQFQTYLCSGPFLRYFLPGPRTTVDLHSVPIQYFV
jgi:hypothetical protein